MDSMCYREMSMIVQESKEGRRKKMKKWKLVLMAAVAVGATAALVACAGKAGKDKTEKSETSAASTNAGASNAKGQLTLGAAASLEKVFSDKIIPMFNEKYPDIKVTGTYDSSGKIQAQIEEGAKIDVFFSAATKQMDELDKKGLMDTASIHPMLENKLVMIAAKDKADQFTSFEQIANAKKVAIGDPKSVPAGAYAKEVLESMEIWDAIQDKLSLGSNVTEVLNWVADGSASVGLVYATDAKKLADKVSVIEEAPEGTLKEKIVYPIGIVKNSDNAAAAKIFVDFLKTDEVKQVFVDSGFTVE